MPSEGVCADDIGTHVSSLGPSEQEEEEEEEEAGRGERGQWTTHNDANQILVDDEGVTLPTPSNAPYRDGGRPSDGEQLRLPFELVGCLERHAGVASAAGAVGMEMSCCELTTRTAPSALSALRAVDCEGRHPRKRTPAIKRTRLETRRAQLFLFCTDTVTATLLTQYIRDGICARTNYIVCLSSLLKGLLRVDELLFDTSVKHAASG